MIRLNIDNHTNMDLSSVYKTIIDKHDITDESCPAILFVDDTEPMIIESPYGDEVVFLDRESETLQRDLKNVIRKSPVKVSVDEIRGLMGIYDPFINYAALYREAYSICQYLKIEMPAIFFCREKPIGINVGSICYSSEMSNNRVTDVFVKTNRNLSYVIKSLLHELRHAWQHKYHNDWFDDYYIQNTEIQNDDYYFQKSELDADAFAHYILRENGICFHLEDLGEKRHAALIKRMDELKKEGIPSLKLVLVVQKD